MIELILDDFIEFAKRESGYELEVDKSSSESFSSNFWSVDLSLHECEDNKDG